MKISLTHCSRVSRVSEQQKHCEPHTRCDQCEHVVVCVFTFGLNGECHVVSRVISLPEVSESLVGVDLLLSGLVL